MTERPVDMDLDRAIPPELAAIAAERAVAENPANGVPASAFEAAVARFKLWRPGRMLRVAFLDGDPVVQEKVARTAGAWCDHAHVFFHFGACDELQDVPAEGLVDRTPAFGDCADAEIRISFQQPGCWSAVGTDALVEEYFPQGQPTMNYSRLKPWTPDEKYYVVLHEFGHALGMIHEHQSPAEGIRWDRAAVICDLSGPPNNWDPETIERNIFDRYALETTNFSEFDRMSIMLYAIPGHWTLDGIGFPENERLSETDIAFMKKCYPR